MMDTGTRVSTQGRGTTMPLVGARMIDGRNLNIEWMLAGAPSSIPGIRQYLIPSLSPLYSSSTPAKGPGLSSLGPLTNRAVFRDVSC